MSITKFAALIGRTGTNLNEGAPVMKLQILEG